MAIAARSPEWHALRREGIGASDVPAICGMSGYASPISVFEQKVGTAEPLPDNPLLEWGRRLEPVIADAFAEATGIKTRRRNREVRYREWPVLFAHLDRDTADGPVECKSAMTTRGWGETGSSDVPPHVGLQVQAQLLCADRPQGYVAALLGYRDFRWYLIRRDDELLADIVTLLRDFWDHVERGEPPEPDGSESYASYLRRLYPRDDRPERPASPEEQLLVRQMLNIRRQLAELERADRELTQRVQASIAEDGGLLGPGFRISWRQSKERMTTDWQRVAQFVAPDAEGLSHAISANTTLTPGARPFRVTVTDEDDG